MSDASNFEDMFEAAQPLIEGGLKITCAMPDNRQVFGNALLELTGDDLIVRLGVDRSQREVSIAHPNAPDQLVDLGPALTQIGIPNPGVSWPTFAAAVVAILENRRRLPSAIQPARDARLRHWQLAEAVIVARARAVDAVRHQRPWPEIHAANQACLQLERELAEATMDETVQRGQMPEPEPRPHYEAMIKAAQPLLAAGFHLAAGIADDPELFGNAMLELIAKDLVVRLVIDRSRREVSVAAARAPKDLVDLGPVLEQIRAKGSECPWSNFDDPVSAILRDRSRLSAAIEPAGTTRART